MAAGEEENLEIQVSYILLNILKCDSYDQSFWCFQSKNILKINYKSRFFQCFLSLAQIKETD